MRPILIVIATIFCLAAPAKAKFPVPVEIIDQPVLVEPFTTPVTLKLRGLFSEGSINLGDSVLGPRSYTVPEGQSLLVRYATCTAVRGDELTTQFDIQLVTNFDFGSIAGPGEIVRMVPTSPWQSPGPFGDRAVATEQVHAYLNIKTPGGPEIGDTLLLRTQRNNTSGTGGVECVVGGELFPRPPDSE